MVGQITEKNIDTEAVDMDVEYEDCSTELTASDTDSYTDNVNVRSSSGDKVVKQPSEEKLQVVGKSKNLTESIVADSPGKGQIDYVCMFASVLRGTVSFFIS